METNVTSTLKGAEKEEEIHTTLTREIHPICNLAEFFVRWQAAKTFEEMLGLLHVGFNVSLGRGQYGEKEYDEIDRLIFYFTIADKWVDKYLLRLPKDGDTEYVVGYDLKTGYVIKKKLSELRQELARKAFDMLCTNFFSRIELLGGGRNGNDFADKWEETIVSERFFPIILNFFRTEKERFGDDIVIRNLSRRYDKRSHNERQAVEFLLNLAKFLWGWKEPEPNELPYDNNEKRKYLEYLAALRSRVDGAKPWMIEILTQLDELDVLRKWTLELNVACIAKLEEIALRNEFSEHLHPVVKTRPVDTIEEACYLGSNAGWFLKFHELKTREYRRLNAILEAERGKIEADRTIEKLSAKK